MTESLQVYYYIIVFLSMLYAFLKLGFNRDSVLVILIFWSGLFQYLDKMGVVPFSVENLYKIAITVYAVYLTGDRFFNRVVKNEHMVNLAFLLFSFAFWISFLINGGKIVTILSQYLYKYGFVFILFHYLKDIMIKPNKREYYKKAILTILYIQVFLSIIKYAITIPYQLRGGNIEFVAGSMSASGAGASVVVPIVALIFYWSIKNGNFTRKDWVIAISFIMISIASGKRQPIIIFPIILFLLFTYVKKGISFSKLLKYIPVVFLLFYILVRLNPSFNPENKVWGSFDLLYSRDYSLKYYFGTSDFDLIMDENYVGSGYGASLSLLLHPEILKLNDITTKLFGRGLYQRVMGGNILKYGGFGIDYVGLIGGAARELFSFGYFGLISIMIFGIAIISSLGNYKLKFILILYFLWDLFLYGNLVIFTSHSAIILIILIFYTNSILKNKAKNCAVLSSKLKFNVIC